MLAVDRIIFSKNCILLWWSMKQVFHAQTRMHKGRNAYVFVTCPRGVFIVHPGDLAWTLCGVSTPCTDVWAFVVLSKLPCSYQNFLLGIYTPIGRMLLAIPCYVDIGIWYHKHLLKSGLNSARQFVYTKPKSRTSIPVKSFWETEHGTLCQADKI